jgi:ABC-type branched-subunit amino acid transport system substrate-binding protein
VSREQIVDSLKSLKDFPGVTGKIYFDNNKLKKDPKLLIVRKGSFKEIDTSSN